MATHQTTVLEKEGVTVDLVESASLTSSNGFDEKNTKKLVRKMDFVLLPFLSLLYLLSFLDRTNIGNARLAGLEKSLHMKGLDYNIALAVFFPFYVLAEIPSNLMMKKTRPSFWIPFIMVCWGLCCTLMGIVKDFKGLVVARAFLGLTEGGLFPGISFYISMWYCRRETGLRLAIFFSAATIAGAFGGLLARGIVQMEGVAGLAGWQWIFILEGIATFIIAVVAFFMMNDYPSTAKFLNETERAEVSRRLAEDRDCLADEFDLKYFWVALKDWKIYANMFITIGIYCPLYSFSLFLPTIVKTLGYTNNKAQLMSVPPYVVACFMCMSAGWAADRLKSRGAFMIGFALLAMSGVLCLLLSHNPHVKYVGCFLFTSGIYPNVPMGVAWTANNIGGTVKRGVAIAMHVGFGNLGGILASFVFLSKDSPKFKRGYCILLGMLSMSITLSSIMTVYFRRENARRDAEYKSPASYTQEDKMAEREKGDQATFFRFVV